tara:strand:- start:17552 stop:17902 length:351 start_codon:yes stop_codon:yes gene_type:complete
MGYRSQVIAGVPKKDKKKALNIIKDWDYISENNENQPDNNSQYVYFMADYWKWYDGYDDVDKFNDFIDKSKYRFLLAVGEDGALVAEIGEPYDHGVYRVSSINEEIIWEPMKEGEL